MHKCEWRTSLKKLQLNKAANDSSKKLEDSTEISFHYAVNY